MLKKLTIKAKLLGVFLLVGLIPLGLVTVIALNKAGTALRQEALAKFTAVQEIKKNHVEEFFRNCESALRITRNDPYIHRAIVTLNEAFKSGGRSIDSDQWRMLADQYGTRMKDIVRQNGWYDLFLIHADGDIVYTATRESDLGMNLAEGNMNHPHLQNDQAPGVL